MIYIITYHNGTSNDVKIAQIEADDIWAAETKTKTLFTELEKIGNRNYTFINTTPLNAIRKLDALE